VILSRQFTFKNIIINYIYNFYVKIILVLIGYILKSTHTFCKNIDFIFDAT